MINNEIKETETENRKFYKKLETLTKTYKPKKQKH